jgi:hypothetical protein
VRHQIAPPLDIGSRRSWPPPRPLRPVLGVRNRGEDTALRHAVKKPLFQIHRGSRDRRRGGACHNRPAVFVAPDIGVPRMPERVFQEPRLPIEGVFQGPNKAFRTLALVLRGRIGRNRVRREISESTCRFGYVGSRTTHRIACSLFHSILCASFRSISVRSSSTWRRAWQMTASNSAWRRDTEIAAASWGITTRATTLEQTLTDCWPVATVRDPRAGEGRCK